MVHNTLINALTVEKWFLKSVDENDYSTPVFECFAWTWQCHIRRLIVGTGVLLKIHEWRSGRYFQTHIGSFIHVQLRRPIGTNSPTPNWYLVVILRCNFQTYHCYWYLETFCWNLCMSENLIDDVIIVWSTLKTNSCHNDNLSCQQWRETWHHDRLFCCAKAYRCLAGSLYLKQRWPIVMTPKVVVNGQWVIISMSKSATYNDGAAVAAVPNPHPQRHRRSQRCCYCCCWWWW